MSSVYIANMGNLKITNWLYILYTFVKPHFSSLYDDIPVNGVRKMLFFKNNLTSV